MGDFTYRQRERAVVEAFRLNELFADLTIVIPRWIIYLLSKQRLMNDNQNFWLVEDGVTVEKTHLSHDPYIVKSSSEQYGFMPAVEFDKMYERVPLVSTTRTYAEPPGPDANNISTNYLDGLEPYPADALAGMTRVRDNY